MPLKISLDHPTLALTTKIHEISKNFLDCFGFSYFQYLRCFVDGSFGLLTNHTGILEYFSLVDNSPVIFSSFEKDDEKSHAYWFLWDEKLPKAPVQLVRERFNICSGLTLVRRSKNYYDMVAVALPHLPTNPGSFYLNKLDVIEQFINAFDNDHKDLIGLMTKNPISLPEAYRDINYKQIFLSQGKINVSGRYGETYVTTQELACLRLLLRGESHKRIAQLLSLSPRTVETYCIRVKQRTGFSSHAEIKRMMSLCSSPCL